MTPNILIAVANQYEVRIFELALQAEGFTVVLANSVVNTLVKLQKHKSDFAILDPNLVWLEESSERESGSPSGVFDNSPLLFLNLATSEITKIWPIQIENTIFRSFNTTELIARLNAMWQQLASEHEGNILRAGALKMDVDDWTVSVDGKMVELTGKEFGLLKVLLTAKGRVLQRHMLHEFVWNLSDAYGIESRAVDVHIGRLRRKLGPAGGYIITVRGLGYRFGVLAERQKRNRNSDHKGNHKN